MESIARFAVRYPVTVLMLVMGNVLLGFISFGKLGTDLFPDLNNPRIYIELKAGEKPPEEIEKNYVDQIESLAMRQSDVLQVSSITRAGSAMITVEYDWNKDMDEAFLDLQKVLNAFSQNADIEDFTISQYDPNSSPVMVVALKNDRISNMDELRKVAEGYIRNELVRIEGVADVRLTGKEESEVVIETNQFILESYGLTPEGIAAQIASYNRNVSGGSITDMGLKYIIKGVSVLEDIRDLENIIVGFKQVAVSGSAAVQTASSAASASSSSPRVPVYLRDIATIRFANKDPENIVTINSERCIGLSVYKEPKFNTVDAVKSLDKAFVDLGKALPGYEFIKVQDQGNYINGAINEVKDTLILGIILAVLILYVFLRRIGTTMVISVAIPVSIIATFNLMYFNHLTLNIMTLGGLALGAGMLVDNAIVVLENISRNREEGMPLKEAVITGAGQVGGAIAASTITTIVVFLPIVYLHGASGEMFKDQAWTVAFSLISSLFVAMLVIPMLVSSLFSDRKTRELSSPVYFGWYSRFLQRTVEKRAMVIILSVILMAVTALLVPRLGNEFMPKAESSEFTVMLKLPEGTSLERTAGTTLEAEKVIRELLGSGTTIYNQAGKDNTSTLNLSTTTGENSAYLKIIQPDNSPYSADDAITLIDNYLKTIPGLEITFIKEETALQSSLGTTGAPFSLEIAGKDYDQLQRILDESEAILSSGGELYNITTSMDIGNPEVEITIDRFKSSYYNVSVDNIINQIKGHLTGSQAGRFEKDGEMKDITIRLEAISLNQLKDLMITAGKIKVPLSELAGIKTVVSPMEITRRNQARTCYLYAMTRDLPFDKVIRNAEESLKPVALPVDYKMEFTGEELKRKESMSNLSFALILSLILVFMVLAAQFESIIQPFVIMLTIPLAGAGTVWTFLLLGKSLNMMAYIGIIMLGGIAVNNAIILIDRTNQLREGGMAKKDAIILAGVQRIRPIMMTSLTTILALLPLTFGLGESASLRAPMALAVTGGLISSTLLTLFVIPCVYWFLDDFSEWLKGIVKT